MARSATSYRVVDPVSTTRIGNERKARSYAETMSKIYGCSVFVVAPGDVKIAEYKKGKLCRP